MAKTGKKPVKKKTANRGLTTRSAPLARVAPADQLLNDVRSLIEAAREQVAHGRFDTGRVVLAHWKMDSRRRAQRAAG